MDAYFIGVVVVEQLEHRWWRLRSPLLYVRSAEETLIVPEGFITDFASVPRGLWNLCPPTDIAYSKAALLHDRLYEVRFRTRKETDAIFYEAMGVTGCGRIRRWLMWAAVRLFGRQAWETAAERREKRMRVSELQLEN